jgi:ADP-ribose pyrophosphatase
MGDSGQVRQQPNIAYAAHFQSAVVLTAYRTTYTDPEGTERTWESAERLTRPQGTDIDGVGVAAILQDPANPDAQPRILLQKQYRPPIDQTVIEVPAGLMDPNETPETCAVRELKEETGYVGEVIKDKSFDVTPVMFNGQSCD